MRALNDRILLSASDLMRFMGCHHATALDLQYMRGAGPKPKEDDEDAELLQKLGDAHESAHLDSLRNAGLSVVEIPRSGDLAQDADATCTAMASGPDVVFQGAFQYGQWGGWSDFLKRVAVPSKFGDFSYEVTDTKLKRRVTPKHVLQLSLYSDMLAKVQGVSPELAHVWLGDNTDELIRLEHFQYYARLARGRLEEFVANPKSTRPIPCADCALCRWSDQCKSDWNKEDSLFNVAEITRLQVKKLEAAGVETMAALADRTETVKGMAVATFEKLNAQARLQHARKHGEPDFELRPIEPGRGFNLLPEPAEGDVFYDIEGDPHYEDGLEYLHGLWFDDEFKAFWAHDRDAEKQALADLMEFFRARIEEYPGARIYHYAAYEITALRRLTMKYGTEEAFFDRLLRERRFVDLFSVVRGGVVASESDYSIKSMEVFYDIERKGEVKTAGGSVVAYENWRKTEDQGILEEIEAYNRIDCISTQRLRDWLVSIRPADLPWPTPDGESDGEAPSEKEKAEKERVDALRAQLAASSLSEVRQEVLFNLAQFHEREAKPAKWAVFDSVGKDEVDLVDDFDTLAGLEATGPAWPVKRSMARNYKFPAQDTKIRAGDSPTVPNPDGPPVGVNVEEMDLDARKITLKKISEKAHLLVDSLSLHPEWPIKTDELSKALLDVIDNQRSGASYRAVDDLLSTRKPSIKGVGNDILGGNELVAGTVDAVARMDGTTLPIQGPPGAGKTHVSAHAILSLVREGARVGVSSNSHKAIQNVLLKCHEFRDGQGLSMAHKVSSELEGYPENCGIRLPRSNTDEILKTAQVVGGTAFFFCRDDNIGKFDWLFVDEAGQVSLANMVAMGRAAKNIVLVGDPCQLPQVIQGSHPHPAHLSCLQWMLGDDVTIPKDRGIFLPTTYRMHPKVCSYISDQVYESRLKSNEGLENQRVAETPWPDAGAYWVPCAHEGNSQVAAEEVEALNSAIEDLLQGTWTDKDGLTRTMRESDIIVVAPYNAQVNALRRALPVEVPVGTVDKFQGQEAPVCLVSMTASSIEDIPRGADFLFSLNRINVAVSRAKGLALVFGSDRLREAKCETVEQMRRVNTLCALPVHHCGV